MAESLTKEEALERLPAAAERLRQTIRFLTQTFPAEASRLGPKSPFFWMALGELSATVLSGAQVQDLCGLVVVTARLLGAPSDSTYRSSQPCRTALARMYTAAHECRELLRAAGVIPL